MSEPNWQKPKILQMMSTGNTRFVAGWLAVASLSVILALGVSLNSPKDTLEFVTNEQSKDAENLKTKNLPLEELEDSDMSEVMASVALPPLYGGLIGRDISVTALAKQYEDLALRLPVLFGAFDPLIRIEDGSADLQASLIAGPFETPEDARLFCRTLRLEHQLPCDETRYWGETFLPR